jgi:hypothetical protein
MCWEHASVFQAVVARSPDLERKPPGAHFVRLYRQKPLCAILYPPTDKKLARLPLHLHPGKASWNPAVYDRLVWAIGDVVVENNRIFKFLLCTVKDWDVFAAALDL